MDRPKNIIDLTENAAAASTSSSTGKATRPNARANDTPAKAASSPTRAAASSRGRGRGRGGGSGRGSARGRSSSAGLSRNPSGRGGMRALPTGSTILGRLYASLGISNSSASTEPPQSENRSTGSGSPSRGLPDRRHSEIPRDFSGSSEDSSRATHNTRTRRSMIELELNDAESDGRSSYGLESDSQNESPRKVTLSQRTSGSNVKSSSDTRTAEEATQQELVEASGNSNAQVTEMGESEGESQSPPESESSSEDEAESDSQSDDDGDDEDEDDDELENEHRKMGGMANPANTSAFSDSNKDEIDFNSDSSDQESSSSSKRESGGEDGEDSDSSAEMEDSELVAVTQKTVSLGTKQLKSTSTPSSEPSDEQEDTSDGEDSNSSDHEGESGSESGSEEEVEVDVEGKETAESNPDASSNDGGSDTEPIVSESQGSASSESHESFADDQQQHTDDMPIDGFGNAADLMVLDYFSQCVIDEVQEISQLLKFASPQEPSPRNSPNPEDISGRNMPLFLRRLECIGQEHAMFRKHHFTHSLFLTSEQRPSDEVDIIQWAMSMQRINLATFLLLVFSPHVSVVEPVGRKVPNREHILCSLGLEAAAKAFFTNIVPTSKRDAESLDLLIDIKTQQWLQAANDERHLQSMVVEERGTADEAISRLLYIDQSRGEVGSDGDNNASDAFDRRAVSQYRNSVNRRLNKLSGGKLHMTRSRYSLDELRVKVAAFASECASSLQKPAIIEGLANRQSDTAETPAIDDDYDDESDAVEAPVIGDDSQSDTSVPSVKGGFEVTIVKNAAPDSEEMANRGRAAGGLVKDKSSGGSTDASFLEERKVAMLLRDALADTHLEELLDNIDAEHIDVPESRVKRPTAAPQRLGKGWPRGNPDAQPAASPYLNSADVHSQEQQQQFRIEEASDVGEGEDQDGGHRRVSQNKRRRAAVDNDDADFEPESDISDEVARIAQTISVPNKRGRIHYEQGPGATPGEAAAEIGGGGEFRGRRGIHAEDMSRYEVRGDRIQFTPSLHGSPDAEDNQSEVDISTIKQFMTPDLAAQATSLRALGQYRPLQMARSRSMQPGASSSRAVSSRAHHPTSDGQDAGDGEDVSDAEDQPRRRIGQLRHSNSRRQAKPIQRRTRWSSQEEECLIRAVFTYGLHWAEIERHHGADGTVDQVLRRRNRVNLKDKARNIKIRLLREGKPLGPFADASGHL